MPTTKRSARHLLVALVLVALSVVGLSAPASAATYAGSGSVGPYSVPTVECRHLLSGGGLLKMTAKSPTVYAYNYRAGGGNDGAWVRFAVYYRDVRTGAVLTNSGWSEWAYAYDNAPAAFDAVSSYSRDWRGQYVVDYRIEWWSSSSMLGYSAHQVDRYAYVASNTVAGGVWQTCTKVY